MYYESSEAIKQAIRQIERWIFASKQDKHPGIALLHANYAVGDLDMLRQMYDDAVVFEITGKNPLKLLREATQLQDKAQREVMRYCPGIKLEV